MNNADKFYFYASNSERAQEKLKILTNQYGQCAPENADYIVTLGGDGTMLRAFHHHHDLNIPFYGMNLGSLGFLMNPFDKKALPDRIEAAQKSTLHPLRMEAKTADDQTVSHLAFNEVSLLRQLHNAAKLSVHVDGKERLAELVCDGIIACTSAGSTAYNFSAHGPIIPLGTELICLTPISAFRPRRWRGALLPEKAEITIKVLEHEKRPVSASADIHGVQNVTDVKIWASRSIGVSVLSDPDHHLDERILKEQFMP